MAKVAKRAAARRVGRNVMQRKENIAGYLFISPYVLAFIIFTGIPFIASMMFSFLNIKYITKLSNLSFVGFDNFVKMFKNPGNYGLSMEDVPLFSRLCAVDYDNRVFTGRFGE